MALPNTLNSVTVRRVSALLSGVWSKVKAAIQALDATVVHKTGSETITGVKIFNNDIMPHFTAGSYFSKNARYFSCSSVQDYSDWPSAQKDGNHFRQWTIDITSLIPSSGAIFGWYRIGFTGSYNKANTGGYMEKVIASVISLNYLHNTEGDYTVAQSLVNSEFAISNIIYEVNKFVIKIINKNPSKDNFPRNLLVEAVVDKIVSMENVTVTYSVVEGMPSWAGGINEPVKVTAGGSPVLTNATSATVARTGSYNDLSNKPSIPIDSGLVHLAGAETITGIKTFSSAASPRHAGDSFAKQSKVFACSVITPYADWTASQKDGNHYRTWTIDLTSAIVASSTHCNIVLTMMGSYYSTPGNGTLQKVITFQIYNGNVVISKGNYTVAQPPCADEFEISDVFKSGSHYYIQVVNSKPTANNYPLRLEIEMFNRYASAVLDAVTMTESITEGLPSWASGVAQVTADRAAMLDSKWYYYNASSTPQWLKVLSVAHSGNTQSYAGDIFAVASRDAGDNNCQSLLTVSAFSYGGTTLEAKHLVLGMRTTSFGDPVFYIYRQDETHYTLYVYLTRYSGVKIAPVICGGAITYETGSYSTQPSNTAPIDRFVNIFTSSGAGIGGPLLPTYVDAKGLEVPCSSSDAVIGINLIGKNISSFDTELTPIIPNYIYFPSQTDTISGYSLNIQRLVQGKVYKLMLRNGGHSMHVKLGNYHDGGPDTFEVHQGQWSGRTVNSWELPDGTHGTSYTTHIVRVDDRTIYIIDGY